MVTPVVAISDADFVALAQFLAREAGLVFDASRRPGLTAVVTERMSESGCGSVAEYLAYVTGERGADERQRLLDGVTIQETHFYRNGAQIDALRLHLLPDLMRRAAAERRPLRVWSAGCSTGEEPYTLAMLCLEVRAFLRLDVEISIVGTDVSAAAVAVAEQATYGGRTIDLAEDGAVDRWFEPAGEPGQHRVRDEVRSLVSFRVHNLVTDPPPFLPGELDLVVCRNVTIYFARDTTRGLVERFYEMLRPTGYLLLGHAETLWQVSDAFALVPVAEAFAYRKEVAGDGAYGAASGAPGAAGAPGRGGRRGRGRAAVSRSVARAKAVPRTLPARRPADPLLLAASETIAERSPNPAPPARVTPPAVRTRGPGLDALIAARAAWAEGRYDQVVDLAGRALHADPLLTDAYVLRGQALSTIGDDGSALDALRKAVYLEPAAGHAHFLLAGALSRLGQPEAAARSFRAAASSLPLVSAEQVRFLLDGRDVDELVALCDQLADASERAARAATVAGRSST